MGKLTPKLIDDIANLIKRGNFPVTAAQACGVPERTWYEWLRKGKGSARGLHRELFDAVELATAKPQITVVNKLYEVATEGNVKAIELFLSRRYPEQWGAQKTLNLAGVEDKPVGIVQMDLSQWQQQQESQAAKLKETLAVFADEE
jgi:hypothetical protein